MRLVGLENWMTRMEARMTAYELRLLAVEQGLRNVGGS